ncbi:MAG: 5-deoxy-glucuronate isomerase, partial [Ilumatobacteraceae bacterium]
MGDLHRVAGSLTDGTDPVRLTPEQAGWARCGLRVLKLTDGEERTIETGDDEVVVLPLSMTRLAVDVDGVHVVLAGRTSVFDRVADFVYAGRDS